MRKRQQKRLPEWEPLKGCEGRSMLVEIDTFDLVAAVGEFEKHLRECAGASLGEDVRPNTGRSVDEVNECEEHFETVRAFERVVGDVAEVVFFGAFV